MSFTGMTARTGPKISLRSNEPGEYSHRSQGKRRLLAHEGIPRGNIVDDGRCHISLVHIHFAAAHDSLKSSTVVLISTQRVFQLATHVEHTPASLSIPVVSGRLVWQ